MNSESVLLWGVLFGAVGLGYFTYGRKQRAVVPFLVGVAFFIMPYLITNVWLMLAVGGVLALVPYFIRI